MTKTIKRNDLISFLNEYFQPYRELAEKSEMVISDVQVLGSEDINKVGLGVSAHLEFFQQARAAGCNFLIVHHAFSLNKMIVGNRLPLYLQERMKFLFQNEMTLAGYHFLLDHHPEIGNNAFVLKELGASILGNVHGAWGWYGDLPKEKLLEEVLSFLERFYDHKATVIGPEPRTIKRAALVSGSGGPDYEVAEEYREKEIDLLVTGELKESHFGLAHDTGLTVAAFGHYNTEIVGVKNLGEVLEKHFPELPVEFINVPNEL